MIMESQKTESETQFHQHDQQQVDEEVQTLSAQVRSRGKVGRDKLAIYQQDTLKKSKHCLLFQTKYQMCISFLVLVFIGLGAYLVYDNHLQEEKIDQLITKLQKDNNPNEPQQKAQQGTTIPKTIWYYNKQSLLQSHPWTQQSYQNIKAQGKDYKISLINSANWRSFLPSYRQQKIDNASKMVNQQIVNLAFPSNLAYQVLKHMVIMQVLIEKGGVYIDQDVVLTESLAWIQSVSDNPFINAKQLITPKVIGFYDPNLSSDLQKHSSIISKQQVQKYIVKMPSLAPYFIASVASSHFLQDVFQQYSYVVEHFASIKDVLKAHKIDIQFANNNKYNADHLFYISCQLALRKKQLSLESKLAIEHYGLAVINENYGPRKIRAYLGETQIDKIFNHLSLLTHEEMEYQFGFIRYLAVFSPLQKVFPQYQKIVETQSILKQSFIHKFLLKDSNLTLLDPKQQILSQKQWSSLPKKLWTYIQTENNSFFMQVWMQHLKKIAQQSNYELTIITEQTLHNYLPQSKIASINSAISSHQLQIYQSTKSQLISLAVLYEHGGVWVQPYTVFVDNLDWLSNIGQQRFLWNHFGSLPKIVVAFHPHFGSPFHWNYDESGVKEAWHLAYQHSMIAAEAKSELISDWLNEIIGNINKPYGEVLKNFQKCQIKEHKWISQNNQELLSQDSIKCVLGAKAAALQASGSNMSSSEYYGLWGINGFAGLLKMRQYTDFHSHRSMNNPFLWRNSFEYMQQVVGKVRHFSKIYAPTASKIQQLYNANYQNISRQIHSQSFLMQLIGNQSIVKKQNKIYLSTYLEYEEKIQQQMNKQSLQNIPKYIWLYRNSKPTLIQTYMLQNIEDFANKSGFTVNVINQTNFKQRLNLKSSKWLAKLNSFFQAIQAKIKKEKSNLKDHYSQIKANVISLCILYEFGGIFISNRILLHQNLNWLTTLKTIPYGQASQSIPRLFAFYSPGYSSKKNSKEIVEFPSLQNFFIASVQKSLFINDFLEQLMIVVRQNTKVKQRVKQLSYSLPYLHGDDPYYECFFLASQFTFKKKSDELKKSHSNQTALDYYGVYTVNTHFYPYKLERYYSSFKTPANNVITSLGKTFIQQLQDEVGKIGYLSIVPYQNQVNSYLQSTVKESEGNYILNGSFIQKYLLMQENRSIKIIQMNYSVPLESKQWDKLPKTCWIYIEKGVKASLKSIQMLFIVLQKRLKQAGFELKEVNDSNIDQYIDKLALTKINKLISKDNQQYKSLLYRLAILTKHGGISISHQMLPTQQMNWIRNIGNVDKRLIFNRYGSVPNILLLIDSLRSPYDQWSYEPKLQSKVGYKLGWSDNLIVAQKENSLIKEWYNQLTTYLELDSKEVLEEFEQCKLSNTNWWKDSKGKLGLGSLLCVLSRKQKQLESQKQQTQVCDYYKLWGISESLGVNKLQQALNLDNTDEDVNPFLWRWPRQRVQGLIGEMKLMVRMSDRQLQKVSQMLEKGKQVGEGSILKVNLLSMSQN